MPSNHGITDIGSSTLSENKFKSPILSRVSTYTAEANKVLKSISVYGSMDIGDQNVNVGLFKLTGNGGTGNHELVAQWDLLFTTTPKWNTLEVEQALEVGVVYALAVARPENGKVTLHYTARSSGAYSLRNGNNTVFDASYTAVNSNFGYSAYMTVDDAKVSTVTLGELNETSRVIADPALKKGDVLRWDDKENILITDDGQVLIVSGKDSVTFNLEVSLDGGSTYESPVEVTVASKVIVENIVIENPVSSEPVPV